jgi:hypothetical protein
VDDSPTPPDGQDGTASGYTCPICGGELWERHNGHSVRFECRIDHPLEAVELWIAHCVARNTALQVAARALAENAALAWKLAAWSRARGNLAAAARIDAEADLEAQYYAQVQAMLDGLKTPDPEPT